MADVSDLRGRALGWALALALVGGASTRAQILVNAPLVHDVEAHPGAVADGVIPLLNESETDRRVRVYLTDYAFDATGTTRYDAPGTLARSASAWVEVGGSELVVPAKGSAEVRYRIRVPDAPGLDGTRWCVLMIEDATAELAADGERGGLRRRVRYGVQLAVHFGGAAPDLTIADLGVAASGSGPQLWVDLDNAGGATADTEVSLELFGPGGESQGRRVGGRARLYPETSYRHRVGLNGVPPGRYTALLIVETGDEHAVGSQFTLQL